MYRIVVLALLFCWSFTGLTGAQERPIDLAKIIDLGPLEEYFTLVTADHIFDPARGGTITITLEAKKDVDTSRLFFKVGFFDKKNHLHSASPLRFSSAFPLRKGESIDLDTRDGREPQKWHKIVVREVDKPAPSSVYHYR